MKECRKEEKEGEEEDEEEKRGKPVEESNCGGRKAMSEGEGRKTFEEEKM